MSTEIKKSSVKSHDELDLVSLFNTLLHHYKFILGFTIILTLFGILYVMFATPIYKADALIQVEQKSGGSLLNDITSVISGAKLQSTTEIEIIRSRMILGKTVHDLNLDNHIEEAFFPIFGKGWARLTRNNTDRIALTRLSVPEKWKDKPFILKILDDTSYILTKDDHKILEGKVGEFISENGISLLVSDIDAKAGSKFEIIKLSELKIIDDIAKNLFVVDKGKDSGMLELSLTGEDPVAIRQILDQISKNYLEQNVERKSEEAAKSLIFLREQLPRIRLELDESENKLNNYRQANDSIDLSLEAKSILDLSVSLETQLNQLTFKEAEVSKLYTKEHPSYRALLEKRQTLLKEKEKIGDKISFLPQTQQEILRLTRDVQANNEVYMQLLNKQQELSIAQASTVGNVRIIDNAVTQLKPVKPAKTLLVLAAFLSGLLGSSGLIIAKTLSRRTIERVEQIEELGVNVYASIPLSDWQVKQDSILKRKIGRHNKKTLIRSEQLVSVNCPTDLSVEALRSLRTSLHFAMMEEKNNVLAISGCSPEIGKTFITANLAMIIADSDKKVLLIDADMRKGYLHELLKVDGKSPGLSGYLCGRSHLDKVIHKTPLNSNVDFIPRGSNPPNPSELLMHSRLAELLEWASRKYDIVLVDTPPVLAVTDACIIGRYSGTIMMVVGYGKNTVKELEFGLQRFEQNDIEIKGVIFNGVLKKPGDYYQYGYKYGSEK
ncbi:polysaccharide biosynthesis tyrosine autokinase [Candidatus Schmidhempelia bombi]|uniref:Polysaccharide biosynthesis tyrosine autokinase n=1 Tax=Candidatus Schmidhempelia bombi str. Bimp TaxID=1387197 RepID=A0AB94IC22_9GAMM|nr:polysaccharide biosynthesis tyrosine autokinase [Candidatus Schmidhempelia bombi]TEA26958.1 polysaccharide biosynthesis tyrosine autokinase [Candidatus Schmidhempelia bombi str. Bimp]